MKSECQVECQVIRKGYNMKGILHLIGVFKTGAIAVLPALHIAKLCGTAIPLGEPSTVNHEHLKDTKLCKGRQPSLWNGYYS